MIGELWPALRLTAWSFVACGLAYPLGLVAVSEALFPAQARGSLIGTSGSALVGQAFAGPRWFVGRPSAVGYDARAGGASNQGPTSRARAERLAAGEGPADLRTQSASGLDPHISPAAARWQVARVAAARGLPVARVAALVEAAVEEGVLGAPRVNVLRLNLALEAAARGPARSGAVPAD